MKVLPGGDKGKKSLVDQALAVPVVRRTPSGGPSQEQVELAVAWYEQKVTSKQVSAVTNMPESAVSSKMQTWLRAGIQMRLIEFANPATEPDEG